jgi:hypothetical protein
VITRLDSLLAMNVRSIAVCIAIALCPPAGAADVTISNDVFDVRWHEESSSISITSKASGRTFLRDVSLSGRGGEARIVDVEASELGTGRAIEITYPGGEISDQVMLFSGQPFVFVRSSRLNRGTEPTFITSITPVSGRVDLGRPIDQLQTFGTAGLRSAAKNPGSYAWLAVVEPASRNGVVFGWLTHDQGSGVLFTRDEEGAVRVDARLDYGKMLQNADSALETETLAIGYFADARLGLEAWADAVAKHYRVRLPPQPVGYCTWYSRPHGGASDETHLAELAEFSARELAPFGFSVVQIDDKWQAGISTNGPKRVFLEHAPDGPYPSGMKAAADHVTSLGLTPGIWYMPFAGTHYDPYFKEKQEWFVKRENGEPYETDWGGTCLDLTNSEVRDYVRSVAERIVNEWGFRYLKIDGLWTGTATKQQYVNSGFKDDGIGDAVFSNPGVSNIAAYRHGLQMIRDVVGRDTFILGCNGPQNMRSYAAAIGYVDAMRVGPDNGSDWEDLLRGPEFGSRHYFMHRRVWYNDPDPVYVRDEMPLAHARLICSWVAISGQLNLSSEWIPGLPAERLDILKRTMPSHKLTPRPVDLFEHDPPRIWLLTDERNSVRRDVIGLFNWTDKELTIDCPLERIGLDGAATHEAFDYWANELMPAIEGTLSLSVPAQSCRILAVRPRREHPQVLSTSRHVTQGIIDLEDERWDPATRKISGVSRLVAGDPYELRVLLPETTDWIVRDASFDDAAEATFHEDGGVMRVTLQSAESRDLAWSIEFNE